jgi:hypothetical protein
MMHSTRTHTIVAVANFDALAEALITTTWSLTTGFRCGHLTLLNDSLTSDGKQEYAVFRKGEQVESLTVSPDELGACYFPNTLANTLRLINCNAW